MKIKTVTGSTIQAALAEAREQLGENVVLLESIPAEGGRPACIKVAVDMEPAAPIAATRRPEPVFEPVGFGYAAGRRSTTPVAAAPGRPMSAQIGGARTSAMPAAPGGPTTPPPPRPGENHGPHPATRVPSAPTAPPVDAQMQAMQRRLEQLERTLTGRRPSTSPGWRENKLLRAMEKHGLRPKTLERLHARVQAFRAETGLQDAEAVLIRNELRRMLQMPVLRPAAPAMLVLGSAGSGKTSLLLKLALHEEYFGRRRAAVIAVVDDEGAGYYDAIDQYRRGGIPVQTVGSRRELHQALERVARFDHVLIDTPSLPVDPAAATALSDRVRTVVEDIVPLHVQLLLDASRTYSDATISAWSRLSMRPSSVAVTHLDEAHEWGRFAEWLMALGLPYGYASRGAGSPESLAALSASHIAERLTSTGQ